MRQRRGFLVLSASLLLAAGSCMTGCATTGTERATKTTNTMQTVESDYRQVNLQVDATNASLQSLISPDQVDIKKAFDNYKSNADRMEKLGKKLNKDTEDMTSQGQNYFSEWEKQGSTYTNPQIRQLSEERRGELRQVFSQIPQASIGVKGSLNSYLSDIKDIKNYLSNDLTPSGVAAIAPVARKAMQDGEGLKTSVQPVLAAIDRARTAMAQGGAGGGAATGGSQSEDEQPAEQNDPDETEKTY